MRKNLESSDYPCSRRQLLGLLGSAAFAATHLPAAFAKSAWNPDRSVRLVIPYSPGGGADIVGRILANTLQPISGQPWVVENRPGAAGNIASDVIDASKPDGLTYQITNLDISVLNPYLYPSRKQKIEAAIPVAAIARIGTALMVRPGLPARDLVELTALAKVRNLTYSSWGMGSSAHLGALLLEQEMQIPAMVHVPYSGGGQAMQALLKGEVDIFLAPMPLAMPQRSGAVGAIGYAAAQRSELWSELPTLSEQDGPAVDLGNWFAVAAPPQTPATIVNAASDFVKTALLDTKLLASLKAQSMVPFPSNSIQLARFIADEKKRWGQVIANANLNLE